ncbi:OmpL47-type beta-barrel domain-containing protein [Jiangella gansuensis]|uniref:OmpL47-type beta-barrel domain-containing protein n=1 Tax=Jiangella gansuensis TaxID=281473 RepID=UPI00047E5AB4|nr:S8 family serine peptidase [Jiangella gansuensis]
MTRRLKAGVAVGAVALAGYALMATPAQAGPADPATPLDVSAGLAGNAVNLAGPGLLPVTLHGSPAVDVTEIDLDSVTVGDGVRPARSESDAVISHVNDVDGDGADDLVLHVDKEELAAGGDLDPATAALDVAANTDDGASLGGAASVRPEVSLEIKFAEGHRVRGDSAATLRSTSGRSLDAVTDVLDRHGVNALIPFVEAAQATNLAAATAQARTRSAAPVPDLASWYTALLPADADVDAVLAELTALPEIVYAYPSPEPAPPPAEPTPDFSPLQGYLRPADTHNGIDAELVREDARVRGAGIKVIDLEYNWNPFHEDLQLDWSSDVGQGRFVRIETFGDDHGTAVFGEIMARDNGFGVVGGVPDVEMYGISPVEDLGNGRTSWRPGPALAFVATLQDENGQPFVQPGDALVLEQQTASPLGGSRYAPLEWIPAVFEANQVLTAMGANVVLTGGNGNTNTDDPMYTRDGVAWFDPAVRHSGSIFVGAGGSGLRATDPARARLSFSNYGQRFDLQGWGQDIYTTGYCNVYCGPNGDDHNRSYSRSFSGTSGAGPIVTNAVVAVQSYVTSVGLGPWTTEQITGLLRSTGRPQTTNTSEHIGPLPDLATALRSIEVDAPTTQLLLNQRPARNGSYVNPTVTLTADDSWGSGVDRTMYRIDGGRWVTYTGPFRVVGPGERTIEYRSNDVNDNTEATRTITIVNRGRGD